MKVFDGLLTVAQFKTSVVNPLVWRVQVPGPSKGTSTRGVPGVNSPASAPLNAGALGTGATDFTVESVTLAKLLSAECPIDRGVGGVVGSVVVVEAGEDRVVVVDVGAVVVLDDVVVGVAVVRAPDVEKVKTRTSSSTGLDHINRCALFREVCSRAISCEG